MKKNTNTTKVTISISNDFYTKLSTQADALDISINQLLKQAAIAQINKLDLDLLTHEQRIVIKDFTLYQIQLANRLKEIASIAKQQNRPIAIDNVLKNLQSYNENFHNLIAKLKAQK